MDTQQQILIEQRISNEKKSTGVAYLLWFFLGGLGAHRFYLGKTGSAIAILVLIIGGALLSAILIGIPMLIIGGIWLIVDIFLIPGMVAQDIQRLRNNALQEIRVTSAT
ncbi:TM2 domain-containing protein [Yoonia algicola]|uniref:TM2 domain-containing protein n=1 Tax=Yoonia algicola TaxID=3137368 RepID=A0AAN0M4I2_9RHOB